MEEYQFIFGTNNKTYIIFDDCYIRIRRKGVSNVILHGFDGEKVIDIKSLTGYQFRTPGKMTNGYIQLIFPGSVENKGGLTDAVNDENTIMVTTNQIEDAKKLVKCLEILIQQKYKKNKCENIGSELEKVSLLLNQNKITYEEFEKIKNKLINF